MSWHRVLDNVRSIVRSELNGLRIQQLLHFVLKSPTILHIMGYTTRMKLTSGIRIITCKKPLKRRWYSPQINQLQLQSMLKHLRIRHRERIKYFLNFGLSWLIIDATRSILLLLLLILRLLWLRSCDDRNGYNIHLLLLTLLLILWSSSTPLSINIA